MSKPPRLTQPPTLYVFLADDDPDPITVKARQSDMLDWEQTAHRNKWATGEAGGITMVWYLAFVALRRTGALPDGVKNWNEFRARIAGVVSENDDDDATPTLPGLDPG